MLSINTNLSSLITQNSLTQSTNKLNQAIERMSTGYKINHASDNAANYSISTNMTTKMSAYQVAEDNAAMGLDMVATASENLSQIESKLSRLRALAIQSSNGTYGAQSKDAINSEANALIDEIERLYNTSEYNGIKTLNNIETSKFIKDIRRRDTSNMITLASVDENERLDSGTYSISTDLELAKLATMTDNGLIGKNTEFVLATNIDLSNYNDWNPIGEYDTTNQDTSFCATFDGNGYVISNLKILSGTSVGLFSWIRGSVKNLGIENAEVFGNNNVGTLSGTLLGKVTNCYAAGKINGNTNVGGLCGYTCYSLVSECWTDVSVGGNGNEYTNFGGLLSVVTDKTTVKNCFTLGDVSTLSSGKIGGLTSWCNVDCIIENCYSKGKVLGYGNYVDVFIGQILGEVKICDNENSLTNNAKIFNNIERIRFQIGINSNSSCQVSYNLDSAICGISALRNIGISDFIYEYEVSCVQQIDSILDKISVKQTELGAVTNRLESALDEIAIQYDNLASSRSTLRDADMAKLSSQYIKMQILQQASATLLATANQSPSIALQLI